MQTWGSEWSQAELILYTDSSTALNGLNCHTLRGKANLSLREIMLLAAKNDIKLTPRWITSEENGLADALSRFNKQTVANLCPHWQDPWTSILLRQSF